LQKKRNNRALKQAIGTEFPIVGEEVRQIGAAATNSSFGGGPEFAHR
jgi:hypothetical protein